MITGDCVSRRPTSLLSHEGIAFGEPDLALHLSEVDDGFRPARSIRRSQEPVRL